MKKKLVLLLICCVNIFNLSYKLDAVPYNESEVLLAPSTEVLELEDIINDYPLINFTETLDLSQDFKRVLEISYNENVSREFNILLDKKLDTNFAEFCRIINKHK